MKKLKPISPGFDSTKPMAQWSQELRVFQADDVSKLFSLTDKLGTTPGV